jgi:hypothetical protein
MKYDKLIEIEEIALKRKNTDNDMLNISCIIADLINRGEI